jgi:hypothetical protein
MEVPYRALRWRCNMDMVSDIKRIVDELVGVCEKRITALEEAADIFCDLLEEEWGNGDDLPEKATEKYRRACGAIGRIPLYGGRG